MAPQKKYICAFCARAFSRSEHKQRHERSHTNEKPFHCQYCTSAFVRRDLLQRHCRTVHNVNMVPNSSNKSRKSNSISSPVSPEEIEDPYDVYKQQQGHPDNIPVSLMIPIHPNSNNILVPSAATTIHSNGVGSPPNCYTSLTVSGPNSSTSIASASISKSTDMHKSIINSISLSKKLNIVLSNFDKISILQTKESSKIHYILSNFNVILPHGLNTSREPDDYFLAWNINQSKFPILDTLGNEMDDFIDSFSNSSTISLIGRFYSKFNDYTHSLNITPIDSQKILEIECKICLLYSLLAIGASNYEDIQDCILLFMKSWNLLITNLIPRLNSNTNHVDSSPGSSSKVPNPVNFDIIHDQIMILKNLFTISYICFQLDSRLKDISSNNISSDIIFNYLDDISYIIMSHLEESVQKTYSGRSSRSSSSSSLHSTMSCISTTANGSNNIIDENMSLFWSIYILLSNYFMMNNHPPPKIYKILLGKTLNDTNNSKSSDTLVSIMENLTTSTIESLSSFNNEIVVITLSNELQSFIHYDKMFVYKSKSILHNSIILANKSFNDSDNNGGSYIFEMLKKKMIINSPTKYQGMLNNYIFNPSQSFNWNLLYISIKEFNLENYNLNINQFQESQIFSKFKFNEFFKTFFNDFNEIDNHTNIEDEEVKKDEYLKFIKYLLPFFTKNSGNNNNTNNKNTEEDSPHFFEALSNNQSQNHFINNNLGIASLPILFNHQCLKISHNSNGHWNSFEKKRFNYLLLEWYLTIVKLIIGLKNDSNIYSGNVKGHQRSTSQDSGLQSIHDMHMNQTRILNTKSKKSNEYELSNNYIFQCLIYIMKEICCKVQLPNGLTCQLRDFDEYLNFENDDFTITDGIIYCILKNLDMIMEDWMNIINNKINTNNRDNNINQSNGFLNLKKFLDDYIYSQLKLSQNNQGENVSIYTIPHRHSISVASLSTNKQVDANYILQQKQYTVQHHPGLTTVATTGTGTGSGSELGPVTIPGQIQPIHQQPQQFIQSHVFNTGKDVHLPPILPPLAKRTNNHEATHLHQYPYHEEFKTAKSDSSK
ncbi:hypothetical protein CAAN1_01S12640 [[Candida] anglica]|uniref:C2H2-type domain-containing protein n=1 Tax=[Candida] anglica TaxID=148631 RepID=A0ABP0EKK0_9ASCO